MRIPQSYTSTNIRYRIGSMKKIKKNIGQQKNGVSQQHYEADKDLVAKSGATFCVKVCFIFQLPFFEFFSLLISSPHFFISYLFFRTIRKKFEILPAFADKVSIFSVLGIRGGQRSSRCQSLLSCRS